MEWVEASNLEDQTKEEEPEAHEGGWLARGGCVWLAGSQCLARLAWWHGLPLVARGCLRSGLHMYTQCRLLPAPCSCVGQAARRRRHPGARRLWRARH